MARRTTKVWKVCKCGRSYSKSEWEALELCGTQHSPAEKRVFILELRHCHCGSTITVTRYGVRSAATSPLPR
jgi:hypothetical protein